MCSPRRSRLVPACACVFASKSATRREAFTATSGKLRQPFSEDDLMATGIKDKVAIIGMGCSRFGERWDVGTDGLLAEAFDEALADAGIERSRIDAAWTGSCFDRINVGISAIPAATALRLDGIPVSRVENMCATGTEALRGAAYAVASGLTHNLGGVPYLGVAAVAVIGLH